MYTGVWEQSQQNLITFVMVDGNGTEVTGLGTGFTLQLAKNGGAFAGSAGTKAEMANGWYSYLSTAAEADAPGPISILVTGAGAVQQNLEYVVKARNINGIEFTYTVDDGSTAIEGAQVWISTDSAGNNVIWTGITDASGVARDAVNDERPFLDPGTYYFWVQKTGYSFNNPDQESVSA